MHWGIVPVFSEDAKETDINNLARNVTVKKGLVSAGDKILLVQGFQSDVALSKPSVTILTI